MRKLVLLMTGTTMLAMLAGVAGATHSPGQGPKHDFAAGTLHGTCLRRRRSHCRRPRECEEWFFGPERPGPNVRPDHQSHPTGSRDSR
jgi:hypothetical protein